MDKKINQDEFNVLRKIRKEAQPSQRSTMGAQFSYPPNFARDLLKHALRYKIVHGHIIVIPMGGVG